ncbi:hypothetical protein PPERSA_06272 [Pseudocohnilembus persalinus]|uniref:Transmembrane protein n=1 Tax=Pseudocohnilembus persalinus TaxID=266149 RepID=A0A0V0QW32_PSEPJ|nr:hypothetical protein PPERSA_06272 [Pseudocohnilembus persalinus]|eukprot:KRX06301.1 hypothetical protein PPERSA_06272 [Pseudocohnilembus persalinus]
MQAKSNQYLQTNNSPNHLDQTYLTEKNTRQHTERRKRKKKQISSAQTNSQLIKILSNQNHNTQTAKTGSYVNTIFQNQKHRNCQKSNAGTYLQNQQENADKKKKNENEKKEKLNSYVIKSDLSNYKEELQYLLKNQKQPIIFYLTYLANTFQDQQQKQDYLKIQFFLLQIFLLVMQIVIIATFIFLAGKSIRIYIYYGLIEYVLICILAQLILYEVLKKLNFKMHGFHLDQQQLENRQKQKEIQDQNLQKDLPVFLKSQQENSFIFKKKSQLSVQNSAQNSNELEKNNNNQNSNQNIQKPDKISNFEQQNSPLNVQNNKNINSNAKKNSLLQNNPLLNQYFQESPKQIISKKFIERGKNKTLPVQESVQLQQNKIENENENEKPAENNANIDKKDSIDIHKNFAENLNKKQSNLKTLQTPSTGQQLIKKRKKNLFIKNYRQQLQVMQREVQKKKRQNSIICEQDYKNSKKKYSQLILKTIPLYFTIIAFISGIIYISIFLTIFYPYSSQNFEIKYQNGKIIQIIENKYYQWKQNYENYILVKIEYYIKNEKKSGYICFSDQNKSALSNQKVQPYKYQKIQNLNLKKKYSKNLDIPYKYPVNYKYPSWSQDSELPKIKDFLDQSNKTNHNETNVNINQVTVQLNVPDYKNINQTENQNNQFSIKIARVYVLNSNLKLKFIIKALRLKNEEYITKLSRLNKKQNKNNDKCVYLIQNANHKQEKITINVNNDNSMANLQNQDLQNQSQIEHNNINFSSYVINKIDKKNQQANNLQHMDDLNQLFSPKIQRDICEFLTIILDDNKRNQSLNQIQAKNQLIQKKKYDQLFEFPKISDEKKQNKSNKKQQYQPNFFSSKLQDRLV